MRILVGYAPERSGKATLALGAALARALGGSSGSGTDDEGGSAAVVDLVHVVRGTWPAATLGGEDSEFRAWAAKSADDATRQGVAELAELAPGVTVRTHHVEHRSVSSALIRVAEQLGSEVLVLGSGIDGALGQVTLGSTANRLLHSSPVPVAVSPRGYRCVPLQRLTAAWDGADEVELLGEMLGFGHRAGLDLRAVTFGRRRGGMYPPEVGLRAEDELLGVWVEETSARLADAVAAVSDAVGVAPAEVPRAVPLGDGWRDAVDALEWQPGDVLALGSHGGGTVRRVFLGSSATKIVRHSPVPVVVFPG